MTSEIVDGEDPVSVSGRGLSMNSLPESACHCGRHLLQASNARRFVLPMWTEYTKLSRDLIGTHFEPRRQPSSLGHLSLSRMQAAIVGQPRGG